VEGAVEGAEARGVRKLSATNFTHLMGVTFFKTTLIEHLGAMVGMLVEEAL